MGIKDVFSLIIPLIFPFYLYSQPVKHIVYLKDKSGSEFSLVNPSAFLSSRAMERRLNQCIEYDERDLPVSKEYLRAISSVGIQVLNTSKWLNAVLILADPSQLSVINSLPFVKKVASDCSISGQSLCVMELSKVLMVSQGDYGNSYNQISITGTDQMHTDGFTGKGKLIAVIDAGFRNADTLRIFDSLFIHNRIKATYDFVDQETNVYNDHEHGTLVLSVLGGYLPGNLIGASWQADYLLLRSEDESTESIAEEFNFVTAAEYADSAGADIINCSLGYSDYFVNPAEDYSYSDMDGNTSIITKGADIAASKGILVVASAGNEGSTPWKKITAPADGDSVLAVGAVNYLGYYQYFSSKGPSYDGRIKPDLASQGAGVYSASYAGGFTLADGTSLSCPLITGLAAGLWQAFPDLTNMELFYYLRRSGSQYSNPDQLLGYGIPNYRRVSDFISRNELENISVFPNPGDGGRFIINLPLSENGKEVNLRIVDRTGRLVFEQKTDGSPRLELKDVLTHAAPGIYFMQIIGSQKKYALKLLKTNQ